MAKKVRLCNHNGRCGKNGVYNVSHNDRTATRADDLDKHIDEEMSGHNFYWTWNGEKDFKKAERDFYQERYGATLEERNKRYIAQRHAEKCRSIYDLLNSPKTAPMETVLQIGDRDHMQALVKHFGNEIKARQAIGEILLKAFTEYRKKIENDNAHILNMALHLDEPNGMAHIHIRTVFDYVNEKGERTISQNRALQCLGVELPQAGKPLGRFNNRKQTYDANTRVWWLQAVKTALNRFAEKHPNHEKVARYLGNFETEPERGRKHRLEKNEYILEQQKKQIEQNNRLIEYQEAFQEFVREAEEEEMERQRQITRQRGR